MGVEKKKGGLRGLEEGNYRAIRNLPKARVDVVTTSERKGAVWMLKTDLHNTSSTPALMVRLKAVRQVAGDRILPVIYDDNYVTLMPGERHTVNTEVNHVDTRGQSPRMVVSGFNL